MPPRRHEYGMRWQRSKLTSTLSNACSRTRCSLAIAATWVTRGPVLTKREEIKLAYLEAAQRDGKADTYNAKEEVFDTMFQELQGMKKS